MLSDQADRARRTGGDEMKKYMYFWTDEDGAVTVDWVVLTASVVVVSLLVGAALTEPVNTELTEIASTVTNAGN